MRFIRVLRFLLRHKNAQIVKERERCKASACENSIISAYLAILLEKQGEVRIPKETVSEMIGSYRAYVGEIGDDYVIKLKREGRGVRTHGKG